MWKFAPRAAQLAAVALFILFGGSSLAVEPDDEKHDNVAAEAIAHLSVHGQVVDAEGRPRSNARVVLRVVSSRVASDFGRLDIRDVLAETRTDDGGRFALDKAPIASSMNRIVELLHQGQRGADVIVFADGFGLGWAPICMLATTEEVKIVLKPAAEVQGSVVSDQDKPLAGAQIEVVGISRFDSTEDVFLQEPENLNLIYSSLRPQALADAEGRFRIGGLPTDHLLSVWVRHPDYPRKYFAVAIGEHASAQPLVRKRGGAVEEVPVHINPLKLTLPRGPRASIQVVDESKNPVGGGRVALIRRGGDWVGRVAADGTLRIAVPETGAYRLTYLPPEGQPSLNLNRELTFADEDTETPRVLSITLPQMRVIEGRLVGEGDEQGLAGVTVIWTSASSDNDGSDSVFSKTLTGSDGRFCIAVLPGKGWIGCSGAAPGFFMFESPRGRGAGAEKYAHPIEVSETADKVEPLRIVISRGLVIRGTVVDPSGKPASGVSIEAVSEVGFGSRPSSAITDKEGRFEIAGLNPQQPYSVSAVGDGLVIHSAIAGKPEQPLTESRVVELPLVLEEAVTLTGRILFGGQPLAGVRLNLRRSKPAERGVQLREVATATTDSDGRYRLSGLKPGDSYQIDVKPPFPGIDPAWRHQSPWLPKVPDGAGRELELADMLLRRLTQSLAGKVVDPDGKPVVGAHVGATLRNGQSLSRTPITGPAPWTDTDKHGRFELKQLPEEPLGVIAYMQPKGADRRIRFPARVNVDLNQQDVRIVLDPSLTEED